MTEREFWKNYEIAPETGCWLWTRYKDDEGYGRVWADGKLRRSHRMAWFWARGPIPDAMCVLHHCDDPRCINPEHLFIGTEADNARDREEKGRQLHVRGEANGKAKLTQAQVDEICERYVPGVVTQKELAREYGVSNQQIQRIVMRKNWK